MIRINSDIYVTNSALILQRNSCLHAIMPYRIRTTKLFLTYPQCTMDKQEAYDYLLQTFNPSDLCVAHELHKNGDHHLHAYLSRDDEIQWEFTDPSFADLPGGFHGNYQAVRSPKNVIKYCTKEEDYISSFDINAYVKSVNGKRRIIGASLIDGSKSLVEAVREHPELIFGYKKLQLDLMAFKEEAYPDVRESLPFWLPNPWGKVLPSKRNKKRRHYWIYSRLPNQGKTTMFLEPLEKSYRGYVKCGDFTYWNVRPGLEFIALDDYNAPSLKYHVLNQMADGTYEYRRFQGGIIRLDHPLIIICSNHSIVELYPHMSNLLHERFIEYEVELK